MARRKNTFVMFKNETHNHPTEIEPFGGAATCLGGAIRDPLSGRTYVYQAMRITRLRRPRAEKIKDTMPRQAPAARHHQDGGGRLLLVPATQIGLATGIVDEVYHPGYKAKRLETGFVVGGARRDMVYREKPRKGDVIILLGGETGRDGCGGRDRLLEGRTTRTPSRRAAQRCKRAIRSPSASCSACFCTRAATRMIKKCNDFGAGRAGSVAIGELSDGAGHRPRQSFPLKS